MSLRIRCHLVAGAIGFVLMLGGTAASASSLGAVAALKDFNALIDGNVSTPSDIEGAALVGGDFSGATIYSQPPASLPAGFAALTVYGNTSGNWINLENGGSAYVGGIRGAGINFNGGGGYAASPGMSAADFGALFGSLSSLSTSLSNLSATSALPATGNNEVIVATPNAKGVAVFNISATQLDAVPSYQIDLNGATTVIFNVSGGSVDFGGNAQGYNGKAVTATAGNVIWNFFQATAVNLRTQLAGTVLAVKAGVTANNQIDGALAAKSFSGSGELHYDPLVGPVPGSVPEPSTWAMMLIGVGALGAVARRRRAGRAESAAA